MNDLDQHEEIDFVLQDANKRSLPFVGIIKYMQNKCDFYFMRSV